MRSVGMRSLASIAVLVDGRGSVVLRWRLSPLTADVCKGRAGGAVGIAFSRC